MNELTDEQTVSIINLEIYHVDSRLLTSEFYS